MKPEILYGIHPVLEALKAGRRRFFEISLACGKKSKRLEEIKRSAETIGIPVGEKTPERIRSMTGTDNHQGAMAKVGPYPLMKIEALADGSQILQTPCFLLLLDEVVDPRNLGALIRTALGVGVDGVVITRRRSASPTPAVSNASAGALEHVRLARVANMTETIKALKRKGMWVVGMDRRAVGSIFDGDLSGSIALVIGGEEKGIRPLVRKHCDMLLSIPQSGAIDSLNASVAGAVAMYEAYRQRSI